MPKSVGRNERLDPERGRGIMLLELLRDGTMTLGAYKKRCEALGVHFSEFLRGDLVHFVEIEMEGGEHVGKGAVSEREPGDDSVVSLTERGKESAGFVRRVNDIFGGGASPGIPLPVTRRPRRQRPRQLKLELSGQAS